MTVACELVQKLSLQILSPEMVFVQQKSRLTSRILALSSMAKQYREACWSTLPTFGDLADVFVEHVLVSGKCFKRVDVIIFTDMV